METSEGVREPFKGLGTPIRILIGLLEDGKLMASKVVQYSDYRTGLSFLRQCLSAGLVTLEIEDTWRKTNWYSLTDKGRRVAEHLKAAQEIIDGE